ncbi:MAG TPA: TatD family hydrolase [Thermomicrobiales bacterium]|nr:TatD family hydrolase [Thermomicrobiales bacterium]
MKFVDTHIHLDSDAFDEDRDRVIAASRSAGVTRWINVGYNEQRWETTEELVRTVNGMYCMLGLHPGDADAWSDDMLPRLRGRVDAVRPLAIGETGIDLHWRQDNLDIQRAAFRGQLALAGDAELPAVIHMRDADVELLDVLTSENSLPHIHLHSFDGNDMLRQWVLETDATVGVGGLITRKGSESLRQWVGNLPHDRVVLETDAPYLKPRRIRGKRNEPAYIVAVAKLLSELWGTDLASVAATTTRNAERIFALKEEKA